MIHASSPAKQIHLTREVFRREIRHPTRRSGWLGKNNDEPSSGRSCPNHLKRTPLHEGQVPGLLGGVVVSRGWLACFCRGGGRWMSVGRNHGQSRAMLGIPEGGCLGDELRVSHGQSRATKKRTLFPTTLSIHPSGPPLSKLPHVRVPCESGSEAMVALPPPPEKFASSCAPLRGLAACTPCGQTHQFIQENSHTDISCHVLQ